MNKFILCTIYSLYLLWLIESTFEKGHVQILYTISGLYNTEASVKVRNEVTEFTPEPWHLQFWKQTTAFHLTQQ